MTQAEDPSAERQRRPWPADADWWSDNSEAPARTEAELADAWLRELGLNDARLTGPAPAAGGGTPPAKPEAPRPAVNALDAGTEPPAPNGVDVAPTEPRLPLKSKPPTQATTRTPTEPATQPRIGAQTEPTADAEPTAEALRKTQGQRESGTEPEDEPVGTGPYALPPKVTRRAAPPLPPAIAAMTAPAQLLPVVPVAPAAVTPVLPSQPAAPTDETDSIVDTMLLPATAPAQRITPPPPPPPLPPAARAPRRRRQPWRPALSLPAVVVLALASAFFAWVSAEPFWLAVGHGHAGTATIFSGSNGCRARFVADDATFTMSAVGVAGLRTCPDGASAPAHMVSALGERAYVTDLAGLNARWSIGFGLVVLCGLAIAVVTGSGRLPGWRGMAAVGLSLAAPVVVTLVMLAAAY